MSDIHFPLYKMSEFLQSEKKSMNLSTLNKNWQKVRIDWQQVNSTGCTRNTYRGRKAGAERWVSTAFLTGLSGLLDFPSSLCIMLVSNFTRETTENIGLYQGKLLFLVR